MVTVESHPTSKVNLLIFAFLIICSYELGIHRIYNVSKLISGANIVSLLQTFGQSIFLHRKSK